MNTKNVAQAVKNYFLQLAIHDKLPSDFNSLDVNEIENVIKDVKFTKSIYSKENPVIKIKRGETTVNYKYMIVPKQTKEGYEPNFKQLDESDCLIFTDSLLSIKKRVK